MQAVILDEIKPKLDMVVGTSVGSMVAAAYATGIPNITQFFNQYAAGIFSGDWWIPIPRLWDSAKYPDTGLKKAQVSLFGNKKLVDCATKFCATALEMKTGRRVIFRSYGESWSDCNKIVIGPDSNMLLVDVCTASSAAQSYFPGHSWGGYMFWDGGNTGRNAPDLLAIREAVEGGYATMDEINMLSLGNGQTPWPYFGKDMSNPGITTVAEATFNVAYSGPESAAVSDARFLLGNRHYRLDPSVEDYDIDDASSDTLAAMQTAAKQCLADNPAVASAFA